MKAIQAEIKQNVQGNNSDRKEIRTQINDLEQEEEINIQPEQNEETRIQKGEVKNSRGNGEAKELICMTHGHELKWGNAGVWVVVGRSGRKGRKNVTTVIA